MPTRSAGEAGGLRRHPGARRDSITPSISSTRRRSASMRRSAASSPAHVARMAMEWVATNTPPTSEFFVVPEAGWPSDKAAEWFPVLAKRVSVATVQGREWLSDHSFARYDSLYRFALSCGGKGVDCLEKWADSSGRSFSHVFIPKSPGGACCRALSAALQSDARYAVLFDGPGGEVFVRRDAIVGGAPFILRPRRASGTLRRPSRDDDRRPVRARASRRPTAAAALRG